MKLENSMIEWLAANCLDKVDCPVELLCLSIMIKDNETPDIYLMRDIEQSSWKVRYVQLYHHHHDKNPLIKNDRLCNKLEQLIKEKKYLSSMRSDFFNAVTYNIKNDTSKNDLYESYRLTVFNRNKEIILSDETIEYLLKIFQENHLSSQLQEALPNKEKDVRNKKKI